MRAPSGGWFTSCLSVCADDMIGAAIRSRTTAKNRVRDTTGHLSWISTMDKLKESGGSGNQQPTVLALDTILGNGIL
jgi:hypothetical protein